VAYSGSMSPHTGLLPDKRNLQDQVTENERFSILSSKSKRTITNRLSRRGGGSSKNEGEGAGSSKTKGKGAGSSKTKGKGAGSSKTEGKGTGITGIDALDKNKMNKDHLAAWKKDQEVLKKQKWSGYAGRARRKAFISGLPYIPRPEGKTPNPFHTWVYTVWYKGEGTIKGSYQNSAAYDSYIDTDYYKNEQAERPSVPSPPPSTDSSSSGESSSEEKGKGKGKNKNKNKKKPHKMSMLDQQKKIDDYNRNKNPKPKNKGKQPVRDNTTEKDPERSEKELESITNYNTNTGASDFASSSNAAN